MTDINDLEGRLAAMQEAFNDAPTDSGSITELPPDGEYQALVKSFDVFESKAGDLYLKTVLEVAFDREYAGREAPTIHSLDDPDRIKFLKTHLSRLGADVENLDMREVRPGSELLTSLLDVPVAIAVRTSSKTDANGVPYRNVYLNERLGNPMNANGAGVVGGPMLGGKVQQPATDVPADTEGLEQAPAPHAEDDPPF